MTQPQPGQRCHGPGIRAQPGSSGTASVSGDHHDHCGPQPCLRLPRGGAGKGMQWAAGSTSPPICNTVGGAQPCTPSCGCPGGKASLQAACRRDLLSPISRRRLMRSSPAPRTAGSRRVTGCGAPRSSEVLCLAAASGTQWFLIVFPRNIPSRALTPSCSGFSFQKKHQGKYWGAAGVCSSRGSSPEPCRARGLVLPLWVLATIS